MIGHILAFVCIMIWGSTFVSSKILLDTFTPIELLFIRFLIGFITLCILSPKTHLIN
ncbi:EamA family transporter [Holdemanella biformis]|uniref:EamA family transporter n=1 Tax=Holdemanella biformis TaxID=1735 RepID=UPI00226C1F2B|nr:EamA family transporter [Holdemanella biformis]